MKVIQYRKKDLFGIKFKIIIGALHATLITMFLGLTLSIWYNLSNKVEAINANIGLLKTGFQTSERLFVERFMAPLKVLSDQDNQHPLIIGLIKNSIENFAQNFISINDGVFKVRMQKNPIDYNTYGLFIDLVNDNFYAQASLEDMFNLSKDELSTIRKKSERVIGLGKKIVRLLFVDKPDQLKPEHVSFIADLKSFSTKVYILSKRSAHDPKTIAIIDSSIAIVPTSGNEKYVEFAVHFTGKSKVEQYKQEVLSNIHLATEM